MLARMYTSGFDTFAPPASVVFHAWRRSERAHTFQRDIVEAGHITMLTYECMMAPIQVGHTLHTSAIVSGGYLNWSPDIFAGQASCALSRDSPAGQQV